MKKPYERLIEYAKVNSMSSEETPTSPTTEIQFALANILKDELIAMGVQDVVLGDSCVVYGMPMVAYNIGAVQVQASCENIAHVLLRHLGGK